MRRRVIRTALAGAAVFPGLLAPAAAHGATNTWLLGATNGNWSTGANWSLVTNTLSGAIKFTVPKQLKRKFKRTLSHRFPGCV